ncbi:hypothetical protein BGX38DRAFT_1185575, partial [Terfezia claveryi]
MKGIERPHEEHSGWRSYHKITDEIVGVAGNLVPNICNTEEMYMKSNLIYSIVLIYILQCQHY